MNDLGPESPTDDRLAVSPATRDLLGPAQPILEQYAALLADQGVLRGLIGPREVPRLWSRHLLNCAAVAALLPAEGTVVDVGSGAGLPGVVLAVMRPDLHMVLIEPMERRAAWLSELVAELELSSTEVVRARAEDMHDRHAAAAVTARAVAPLRKLVPWTMPFLVPGGVLLAMKGSRAAAELDEASAVIRKHRGVDGEVVVLPSVPGVDPTTVVRVRRAVSSAKGGRPRT